LRMAFFFLPSRAPLYGAPPFWSRLDVSSYRAKPFSSSTRLAQVAPFFPLETVRGFPFFPFFWPPFFLEIFPFPSSHATGDFFFPIVKNWERFFEVLLVFSLSPPSMYVRYDFCSNVGGVLDRGRFSVLFFFFFFLDLRAFFFPLLPPPKDCAVFFSPHLLLIVLS